ncbi:hypothetical protein DFJ74DRAFT_652429 [Hyaloraphidium curvatum]|nr:hypothetical protein DFJ74DRAFT_652429 [Hyaloraphidium curvatum]
MYAASDPLLLRPGRPPRRSSRPSPTGPTPPWQALPHAGPRPLLRPCGSSPCGPRPTPAAPLPRRSGKFLTAPSRRPGPPPLGPNAPPRTETEPHVADHRTGGRKRGAHVLHACARLSSCSAASSASIRGAGHPFRLPLCPACGGNPPGAALPFRLLCRALMGPGALGARIRAPGSAWCRRG